MNKREFSLPVIDGVQRIPLLKRGASRHIVPEEADAVTRAALGIGERLPPGWRQRAVAKLGELVRANRGLRVFMDACTHCGACTDKCHYFLGTGDPNNMPVARQDLFRSVWRRYFTLPGKWFPRLVGARDLDEDVIDEWYRYFHQCSECRRCTVYCPFGIDTSEVTIAARSVLESVGIVQGYCGETIRQAREHGNNLGMPETVLRQSLGVLEEDIYNELGVDIKLPLDKVDAEVLLVLPSADLFAEPHMEGFIGVARGSAPGWCRLDPGVGGLGSGELCPVLGSGGGHAVPGQTASMMRRVP